MQKIQDITLPLVTQIKKTSKTISQPKDLQQFFAFLHENLYHDIVLKRIKVEKRFLRNLELLSLPFSQQSEEQRQQNFKKLSHYPSTIKKR